MNLKRLFNSLRWHGFYAILDPKDSTVTLSKRLYNHMDKACGGQLKDIYAFSIPALSEYAWCCNPVATGIVTEEDNAPLSDVQYNSQTKTIGFAMTSPTVNQIMYDYRLPDIPVKLTVIPESAGTVKYYRICR